MAVKWYCDQCGKEVTKETGTWTVTEVAGPHLFCAEECLLGWLLDRATELEEVAELGKKEVLVAAVESVLDACHDFLDAECENAIT